MHIDKDDPRPQKVLTTIRLAAMAILRLKPLYRAAGEDSRGRQPTAGEGKSAQLEETKPTHTLEPRGADPTAHVSDEQFAELLTHLPDLNPTTDKRRMRLARYLARFHLGVTPEIKDAIRARAQRFPDSLQRQRAA